MNSEKSVLPFHQRLEKVGVSTVAVNWLQEIPLPRTNSASLELDSPYRYFKDSHRCQASIKGNPLVTLQPAFSMLCPLPGDWRLLSALSQEILTRLKVYCMLLGKLHSWT